MKKIEEKSNNQKNRIVESVYSFREMLECATSSKNYMNDLETDSDIELAEDEKAKTLIT